MKTSEPTGSSTSTASAPTNGTRPSNEEARTGTPRTAREGERLAHEDLETLAHPGGALARRDDLQLHGAAGAGVGQRRRMPGRSRALRAARARNGSGRARVSTLGVARQVQIPEPREPETERRGAHQRRQQAPFAALERPDRLVGGDQRAGAVLVEPAGVEIDAPVVEGDGDVVEQGVDAGEIEVEHAGQLARPRT